MNVRIRPSALRDTRWHEYAIRFVLGGLATVGTGAIASLFGPETGGLFLAFPAIFCASATLIEKHERERKEQAGLRGTRRGKEAAAVDAAGADLGRFGLLTFGAAMWLLAPDLCAVSSFYGQSGSGYGEASLGPPMPWIERCEMQRWRQRSVL